ncbi:MATE family efflux transporter [Comamonas serinivorans]|uniref:MATE family efflux transporter n=2 Tax=Comamonas serinivorans TaxID=1082851 RepID=A0A1Y0ESQ2_9BURK|nr:MATE family efflux transporter [Comamonas serinivorans]
MAYGVTDTVVAGRHATESLAALSVGSAVYISVSVALFSVIQALLPIWSRLHGAGEQAAVGASLRQSLYLCGAAIALGMAVLMFPGPMLRWTRVPPEQEAAVTAYLQVLAWSLTPALLFRLYATFNQSLGRPQMVTWLQVAALGLKVPLSIWFTFGGAGLPALGAVGCAWATLVVYTALCALGLTLMRRHTWYRPYRIWQPMEAPDWRQLRGFLQLGIPAGLSVLVEVSAFTLMALYSARLGAVALAAHQIASNLAAVLYMMPLSMGIALSARVGFWLGAGHPDTARRVAWLGLGVTAAVAAGGAGLMWLARTAIVGGYGPAPDVAQLAITLLGLVALYHLADALQSVSLFVLRCYGVTLQPLLIYCLLLWGAGLYGGYHLAYSGLGPWPALHSPGAFWLASTCALVVVAGLFLLLVWRHARSPEDAHRALAAPL